MHRNIEQVPSLPEPCMALSTFLVYLTTQHKWNFKGATSNVNVNKTDIHIRCHECVSTLQGLCVLRKCD